MRSFLTLLCLLLGVGAALAQEQDRKLQDRIMRPNMEMSYDTSQSSFGKPQTVKTRNANAAKEFSGARSFVSREYVSKEFGGAKRSWFANLFFFTKSSSTKAKYEIPNATAKVDTKLASTREAWDARKSVSTREFGSTDLTYLRKGRSQSRFDLERGAPTDGKPVGYSGDLQPMTIDDVRDLLNKSR